MLTRILNLHQCVFEFTLRSHALSKTLNSHWTGKPSDHTAFECFIFRSALKNSHYFNSHWNFVLRVNASLEFAFNANWMRIIWPCERTISVRIMQLALPIHFIIMRFRIHARFCLCRRYMIFVCVYLSISWLSYFRLCVGLETRYCLLRVRVPDYCHCRLGGLLSLSLTIVFESRYCMFYVCVSRTIVIESSYCLFGVCVCVFVCATIVGILGNAG